ncbi:hypothetical protein COY62_01295 [bacterium (Candidatus Howlettbacteria) CG_4_10_14_0_8_um_filter_40_9]|nr:MAG: hypothetical protein COY62_01295 [bacterium (Candidatus Howlettbacteria) CG_4_10_14_0_8_um_filter_40_9]
MSEDKKPKLSNAIKKELQIETKLTVGRVLWPIFTIILFLLASFYLFKVYTKSKGTSAIMETKSPEEKIENKPDITQEQIDKEKADAEAAAKAAETPAPTPAVAAPVVTPAATTTDYTVKEGDTLSGIAATIGISSADIVAVNPGLVPENIQVGQVIKLPK